MRQDGFGSDGDALHAREETKDEASWKQGRRRARIMSLHRGAGRGARLIAEMAEMLISGLFPLARQKANAEPRGRRPFLQVFLLGICKLQNFKQDRVEWTGLSIAVKAAGHGGI